MVDREWRKNGRVKTAVLRSDVSIPVEPTISNVIRQKDPEVSLGLPCSSACTCLWVLACKNLWRHKIGPWLECIISKTTIFSEYKTGRTQDWKNCFNRNQALRLLSSWTEQIWKNCLSGSFRSLSSQETLCISSLVNFPVQLCDHGLNPASTLCQHGLRFTSCLALFKGSCKSEVNNLRRVPWYHIDMAWLTTAKWKLCTPWSYLPPLGLDIWPKHFNNASFSKRNTFISMCLHPQTWSSRSSNLDEQPAHELFAEHPMRKSLCRPLLWHHDWFFGAQACLHRVQIEHSAYRCKNSPLEWKSESQITVLSVIPTVTCVLTHGLRELYSDMCSDIWI